MARKNLELNDFNKFIWNHTLPEGALPILAGALISRIGCSYPAAMRHIRQQGKLKRLTIVYKPEATTEAGILREVADSLDTLLSNVLYTTADKLIV